MTPQASHRFYFHYCAGKEFDHFVASDLCENFPYDFNIPILKNKCIKAARIMKPDWLVMLSGIDAKIIQLPNFKILNDEVLYLGKRICRLNAPEGCSNWILSKKIYENHLLDENFKCYGWEDFDFVHNECKNIKKISLNDFLTVDYPPDEDCLKLVNSHEYAINALKENEKLFYKKYKSLYGYEFKHA
jgi:hypothetical protein